jgi:hypothetical protein
VRRARPPTVKERARLRALALVVRTVPVISSPSQGDCLAADSASSFPLGLQRTLCIVVLLIVVIATLYAIYMGFSDYSRISV